jgi:hypothetical protein
MTDFVLVIVIGVLLVLGSGWLYRTLLRMFRS